MFEPSEDSDYYYEAVRADVEEWLDNNEEKCLHMTKEQIEEEVMNSDEITGNMTGSYFCNSGEARDCVLSDLPTVAFAYGEFCDAERFLQDVRDGAWETLDVIARCCMAPYAFYEVFSEREEANEEYSDEYEANENDEEDEDNE